MYSTGEAKDPTESIVEDMAKLCEACSKETEISVETINRLSRSSTTVNPPRKPLNFHFFSMKPDSAEEKRMMEEEGEWGEFGAGGSRTS